ncbi:MAG: putative phage tail protein [Selenomonadaceae bacterium]|nr:putative phage tail protein [Selenomonadaceae bacterium]
MSEDRLDGIERTINMRQYLTPVSRDNKDIQSVMDTETVEFQELWNALCDCFNNVYVRYMTQYGLSQWESIYKLHPHADETYADRRKAILAAFAGTRPYTLRKFQEMLDTIYGKGTLTPIVDGDKYKLDMQINWDFDSRLDGLHEFVEEITPKNLWIIYTYFFAPWDEVGDIDDGIVTNVDVSGAMEDEYPWPARRKLDGSWTLGGSRYLNGKDKLDGTWMLDGLKNGIIQLNDTIETLKVTCIQFIDGAFSDTFGTLKRKLNGSWQLNGRNHLGSDALPMDIGGRITVRNRHLLNGTWRLDGGERNLLDGTIPLDGRFKLDGGGRKLTQNAWTDFLDGAKTNIKPSKLLPSKWLHPAWQDDVDASDGMSVWRTRKDVNASESTSRPIGFDEHLPLDGSWELGDNVTPADASGGLEIRQYKRLNGAWRLDGGDRLRLDGKFALDGTHDLKQRGNRLAIRKRAVTM